MRTRSRRLTTVGDLVVAITDIALEVVKNEQRAYQIAGLVVNRMLDVPLPEPIGLNSIPLRVYRILSTRRERDERPARQKRSSHFSKRIGSIGSA